MRIVRYELEIVDYQQIQPLWPGRILAVKPGCMRNRVFSKLTGEEVTTGVCVDANITMDDFRWEADQKIDMWCIDAEIPVDEVPPTQIPVLGVWIVGTGNQIPDYLARRIADDIPGYTSGPSPLVDKNVDFQNTCVMANGLVWHVFTKIVDYVHPPDAGYGEVSSIDDIATKVADRRRAELDRVAEMPRNAMQDRHA